MLAYLGQGARLIVNGGDVILNIFYFAILGQQAPITAYFSLVQQLVNLNMRSLPLVDVIHTSDKTQGQQLYIQQPEVTTRDTRCPLPQIIWTLCLTLYTLRQKLQILVCWLTSAHQMPTAACIIWPVGPLKLPVLQYVLYEIVATQAKRTTDSDANSKVLEGEV